MLFYFKKGNNTSQTTRNTCAIYKQSAEQMTQFEGCLRSLSGEIPPSNMMPALGDHYLFPNLQDF